MNAGFSRHLLLILVYSMKGEQQGHKHTGASFIIILNTSSKSLARIYCCYTIHAAT